MFNIKKLSVIVLVSVLVCLLVSSQIGNAGYIGDPDTVIRLNKFSLIPYKWAIEQFNATAYQSFNSTGYVIQSLDDQALIQACIDDVSAVGGEILIVSGTYTASVTLKNNIRLVIEKGATGITVAIDAGATCCLEDYNNSITEYYSSGVLVMQYNNLNGAVNGIYSTFSQFIGGSVNSTTWVNSTRMSTNYIFLGSLTSDPVSPTVGEMWYRSDTGQFKAYNGSVIVLSSGTGLTGPAGTVNGLPFSYMVFANVTSCYMVNGTTGAIDYSSTNASKVIAFCIGNISSLGGGTGLIKQGIYQIDSNINMLTNTTLILENGVYLNQTKASWTMYNDASFRFYGASAANWITNAHIIGLGHVILNHLNVSQNEHQITMYRAERCSVESIELQNCGGQVVYMQRSNYSTLRALYIHHYNYLYAVHILHYFHDNLFSEIIIDGKNRGTAAYGGFLAEALDSHDEVYNNVWSNCRVDNLASSHGLYLNGGTNTAVRCNQIVGFTTHNISGNSAVQINCGSNNIVQVVAHGNNESALGYGVSLGSGGDGCYGNIIDVTAFGLRCALTVFLQSTNGHIEHNIIHITAEWCGMGMDLKTAGSPATSVIAYNDFYLSYKGCAANGKSGGIFFGNESSVAFSSTIEAIWNNFYCNINATAYGVYWENDYCRYNHFFGNIKGGLANFYTGGSGSVLANYTAVNNYGTDAGTITATNWNIGDIVNNGTIYIVSHDYVLNALT